MPLSVPTRYTGTQQQQRSATHLPLELPGERRRPSPTSALVPTPASASLRSAALPSRTHHRAPPARRPSPASALMPTLASAPLRSAALPSRTHHRAPPASAIRRWQLRQRPRRCPPRRTALVVPSPSVSLLTPNRKARSLLFCGRMSICLPGNHLTSPVFPEK